MILLDQTGNYTDQFLVGFVLLVGLSHPDLLHLLNLTLRYLFPALGRVCDKEREGGLRSVCDNGRSP